MTFALRDKNSIWHPFTQHQMTALPIPIKYGKGAYLYDVENKSYLDLISSWWVNLHGHAQPEIAKAIYEQAMQLEHVIFSGFTHEPALKLADRLLQMLPNKFSKIFYSDNGSTAVEVALKMAYQYWRNQGESQRKRIIAFSKSYHGDTFGAMAVGKSSGFFTPFEEMLFSVDMFPYPETWMHDETILQKEQNILQQIQEFLQIHGHETAAMIIEPLVQGASGMRMCRPEFLQQLQQLMQQYHVLIIYDEVMTGFGRTGDIFACLMSQTIPDIICLAKGLTGGFLPLSVTACHERIYKAFLSDTFHTALAHGHSYTANPLGCAAALASMDILHRKETLQQIHMIEQTHYERISFLQTQSSIVKTRICGTIAAFDLAATNSYGSNKSIQLRDQFLNYGLILRPLGNVVYLLPPYCIDQADLHRAYDVINNLCLT